MQELTIDLTPVEKETDLVEMTPSTCIPVNTQALTSSPRLLVNGQTTPVTGTETETAVIQNKANQTRECAVAETNLQPQTAVLGEVQIASTKSITPNTFMQIKSTTPNGTVLDDRSSDYDPSLTVVGDIQMCGKRAVANENLCLLEQFERTIEQGVLAFSPTALKKASAKSQPEALLAQSNVSDDSPDPNVIIGDKELSANTISNDCLIDNTTNQRQCHPPKPLSAPPVSQATSVITKRSSSADANMTCHKDCEPPPFMFMFIYCEFIVAE